ncbi:MAG: hypothetical protein ACKOKF_00800 [Bacteroidota bacterium]
MNGKSTEKEILKSLLENPSQDKTFRTPAGFFDDLQNDIRLTIGLWEGINTSSKSVFTVPEGYFDELPEKVMRKIERRETKVVSMGFTRVRAALAVAAIVTMTLWINKSLNSDQTITRGRQTVTSEDLLNSTQWDDMDEYILAEAVFSEEPTEDQDIHDYLIVSDVDISQIDIEL